MRYHIACSFDHIQKFNENGNDYYKNDQGSGNDNDDDGDDDDNDDDGDDKSV